MRKYIFSWFIVCSGHLYFVRRFGAAFVKIHWRLGDAAAVWDSTFGSSIRFVQKRFLIVPFSYYNWISNRSVICMTLSCGTKRWSNHLISTALPGLKHFTSNFSSLLWFEIYHCPLNLDWSFEIWNDYGFVQNIPWGLRYFWYTNRCGRFVSVPRGSKVHWLNLLIVCRWLTRYYGWKLWSGIYILNEKILSGTKGINTHLVNLSNFFIFENIDYSENFWTLPLSVSYWRPTHWCENFCETTRVSIENPARPCFKWHN